MDRVVRLNVVDEPVSWRAFPSDPWKRKKAGHLGLRSPLCEPAGGGLLKTMPVYGDDLPYGHHTFFFGKMAKPSTCGFVFWNSGVVESPRFIDVNRHSFEMTSKQCQPLRLARRLSVLWK